MAIAPGRRRRLLFLLAAGAAVIAAAFAWRTWFVSRLPAEPAAPSLVEEAAGVADRLVERYPDDPAALAAAAQVYDRLGEADRAVALWQQCLALAPGHAEAHAGIGSLSMKRGEPDRAEDSFRKALAAAPGSPRVSMLLAMALMDQGKPRETAALLGPLVERAPDGLPMPCFLLLGQAHFQLKDYAKAKPCFEAAVRMAPDYSSARYGLAMTCARLGLAEEHAAHLQRFKELDAAGLDQRRSDALQPNDLPSLRQTAAAACAAAAEVHAARGAAAEAEALRREAATHLEAGSRAGGTEPPR